MWEILKENFPSCKHYYIGNKNNVKDCLCTNYIQF